jgi:lipoate-protein ligase A
VSEPVAELHDYAALRRRDRASLIALSAASPLLVLGSAQDRSVLGEAAGWRVRRRRGGGGVVAVRPGDTWVDWWVPAGDPRTSVDVRRGALAAGERWMRALRQCGVGNLALHDGPVEGRREHAVACFAGRGPGEVFVGGHKIVGLTQWRVREGALLSTIAPRRSGEDLISLLTESPPGLAEALAHAGLDELGVDHDRLLAALAEFDGPWEIVHLSV